MDQRSLELSTWVDRDGRGRGGSRGVIHSGVVIGVFTQADFFDAGVKNVDAPVSNLT